VIRTTVEPYFDVRRPWRRRIRELCREPVRV